jgi:endonuclease/exonuclease/phosphatase (EEP) superfamily protein YafD
MRILVLSLVSSLGCAQATGADDPPRGEPSRPLAEAPRSLTVATYNVLYALAGEDGSVDADTLARATSLDADALLLQETNEVWERALRPLLDQRFAQCTFHHPKRLLPEGLAICVKGTLIEDELLPSPIGWFPAQRAVAETRAGRVQLLNLHLKPAVATPPEWVATHLKTRPDRAREVRELLPRLSPHLPTIIGGDMNEQPEGELFVELAQAGFDNALVRSGVGEATWTWAGAEPALDFQLDHLAYRSPQLKLDSATILDGGRSDHKAVVATFRMR